MARVAAIGAARRMVLSGAPCDGEATEGAIGGDTSGPCGGSGLVGSGGSSGLGAAVSTSAGRPRCTVDRQCAAPCCGSSGHRGWGEHYRHRQLELGSVQHARGGARLGVLQPGLGDPLRVV